MLTGDGRILRAYVLALLVADGRRADPRVARAWWTFPFARSAGSRTSWAALLFGVGMILSGGCSGSTWYRVGEGAIGAWVVLLGFAIGATTVGVGVAGSRARARCSGPTHHAADGAPPTLANADRACRRGSSSRSSRSRAAIWLWRGRREPEHGKWPWPAHRRGRSAS